MIQFVWIQLKLRLALENNVVLIHLRVHRVDLSLAEGVVQRVIDGRWRDSKTRSGGAVNYQGDSESSDLLIGGHVFQIRQLLHAVDQTARPVIQFIGIGIFERVLVLRAAYAIVHADILHGLHIQLHSLNGVQFCLEPSDYVRGADLAITERFKIDRHPTAIRGGIRSVRADKR